MKNYIVLSEKVWHEEIYFKLKNNFPEFKWTLIKERNDFSYEELKKLEPEKIFIPHWSYIIPAKIFENFECVVFHMTDLPYGRGGSPLQNLIVRGHTHTKISALKVEEGLDTGPIYLKKDLQLLGTAQEIFIRTTTIVEKMIGEIIENDLSPIKQDGEIVEFKRRKPKDGNMADLQQVLEIYDHIRMLDCDGYPLAYIESEHFRFEFSRASLQSKKEIIADVRIIKK
ncbi:formyltransferase family protein [Christiangramia forsetii]|uniref:Methionyl-tRNA formyltransferase n=2 Tax=Christiangramia forsetii TaxID=411153 RepID=A0M2Y8_CHRFK|nr:formyltransferase family protein [Christiangramia forsetii]GGG27210.1 hypothetical protein GCM10011532_08290 [Christiangramia forsetii]CAL66983.1 methionyl-tRNA formyltransferase [Christiangramia forsetii KT0803]